MDVVIEVEAATGDSSLGAPRVFSTNRYAGEVFLHFFTRPSASITRFFSMGSTSLSAVSPDNYFLNGGQAVA